MPNDQCPCRDQITVMSQKIDSIHQVLVGDLQGRPGLIDDIRTLKDWRKTVTTRVKNKAAWLHGVIAALIVLFGGKIIDKFWK